MFCWTGKCIPDDCHHHGKKVVPKNKKYKCRCAKKIGETVRTQKYADRLQKLNRVKSKFRVLDKCSKNLNETVQRLITPETKEIMKKFYEKREFKKDNSGTQNWEKQIRQYMERHGNRIDRELKKTKKNFDDSKDDLYRDINAILRVLNDLKRYPPENRRLDFKKLKEELTLPYKEKEKKCACEYEKLLKLRVLESKLAQIPDHVNDLTKLMPQSGWDIWANLIFGVLMNWYGAGISLLSSLGGLNPAEWFDMVGDIFGFLYGFVTLCHSIEMQSYCERQVYWLNCDFLEAARDHYFISNTPTCFG